LQAVCHATVTGGVGHVVPIVAWLKAAGRPSSRVPEPLNSGILGGGESAGMFMPGKHQGPFRANCAPGKRAGSRKLQRWPKIILDRFNISIWNSRGRPTAAPRVGD